MFRKRRPRIYQNQTLFYDHAASNDRDDHTVNKKDYFSEVPDPILDIILDIVCDTTNRQIFILSSVCKKWRFRLRIIGRPIFPKQITPESYRCFIRFEKCRNERVRDRQFCVINNIYYNPDLDFIAMKIQPLIAAPVPDFGPPLVPVLDRMCVIVDIYKVLLENYRETGRNVELLEFLKYLDLNGSISDTTIFYELIVCDGFAARSQSRTTPQIIVPYPGQNELIQMLTRELTGCVKLIPANIQKILKNYHMHPRFALSVLYQCLRYKSGVAFFVVLFEPGIAEIFTNKNVFKDFFKVFIAAPEPRLWSEKCPRLIDVDLQFVTIKKILDAYNTMNSVTDNI